MRFYEQRVWSTIYCQRKKISGDFNPNRITEVIPQGTYIGLLSILCFDILNKENSMSTHPSRCSEYRVDSSCNVKRLRDMSLEMGAWGCAPWWPVFWIFLVFFAPVPHKAKVPIFLIGIAAGILVAIVSPLEAPEQPHTFLTWILAVIELCLIFAYFILSYRALFQGISRRRRLHTSLTEEAWQRLSYCTVHDQLVDD